MDCSFITEKGSSQKFMQSSCRRGDCRGDEGMNRPNSDTFSTASREYRRKLVEHNPYRQERRALISIATIAIVIGLAGLVALVPPERFYPLIRSLLNRGA
jgi:hypothetical protein